MRTSVSIKFQTTERLPQKAVARLWEYGKVRQFAGQAKQYELSAMYSDYGGPADVVSYYVSKIGEIIEPCGVQFREIIAKAEVSHS